MKSHLFKIFLAPTILLAPFHLFAQVCSATGNVNLQSQQDVDEFQSTYGPCTELDETLRISGDDITNLEPLSDLVRVESEYGLGFFIDGNPNLQSLAGLENLKTVNGRFHVSYNPSLSDLAGLAGLKYVSEELYVFGNENLVGLEGLGPDLVIGNWLTIGQNPGLSDLSGLENLEFASYPRVSIISNDALSSLEGLPQFDGLEELSVGDNANLLSLHGVDVIDRQNVSVHIDRNDSLLNLGGLEWLRTAGRIYVSNNPSLTSLSGLEYLEYAASISIANNSQLVNLEGLNSLEVLGDDTVGVYPSQVTGRLYIGNNIGLESLDGLESLVSAYEVRIDYNSQLQDCSALDNLFDFVDHGAPGPGPAPQSGLEHVPDIAESVSFASHNPNCHSLEDYIDVPEVERVLTGSWFNPETAGEGFMIHAVSEHDPQSGFAAAGLAVGYFYGYDDEGERFWLIGVHEGDMNWDDPIEFTATRVYGGTFEGFDPGVISEEAWGKFTFTPEHCDAGVISLDGVFNPQVPNFRKSLNVVRLGKVSGVYCSEQEYEGFSDSLTASWFDPATSGQGLAIHKINDESGIVYFYGFDSNENPLWLIGVWSGSIRLDQTIEIDMIQASGGDFVQVNPENIVEEPWGVLRLRMNDCASGTAELVGLDGSQTLTIRQLAPSLGLECP